MNEVKPRFLPSDLIPNIKYSLSETLECMDRLFASEVENGWVRNQFKDRIFISFSSSGEFLTLGQFNQHEIDLHYAVQKYAEDIKKAYQSVGWPKVTIETTKERGIAFVRVTLFKFEEESL